MLTMVSDLEAAAAAARARSGAGAFLPPAVARTAQQRNGAIAFPRPRAFGAADVFGQRHPAADTAIAFGRPASGKQNYPYTTRITASGGATGPHPAREPDPV